MPLKKYYKGKKSDHFDGINFFWKIKPYVHSTFDFLRWRFEKCPKWPKNVKIPKINVPAFNETEKLAITNIGHASMLIQSEGVNILTDPIFSDRPSPISFFGPKRVKEPGLAIENLPKIDVIFLSHNHYDHMDLPSLQKICKIHHPIVICLLGNDKLLQSIDKDAQIITLDWFETYKLPNNVLFQALPSQHWSARSPLDRNCALWGGVCIYFAHSTVYFAGDTGFDHELFYKIKNRLLRQVDIAILPIGSYEPRWFMKYSHMCPEEAWEAFTILEAKKLIPIHYDVFQLGDEPFGEAAKRLKKAADNKWSYVIPLEVGEKIVT